MSSEKNDLQPPSYGQQQYTAQPYGGYPGSNQPYPGGNQPYYPAGEASSYNGAYPPQPQQSYGNNPPQQYPPQQYPPQQYPPQQYPPQQYPPQQQGYYPSTPAPQPGFAPTPPPQKKSDKEALCYGCALGACLCCCLDGLC